MSIQSPVRKARSKVEPDSHLFVDDGERVSYFGPQKRWYLVVRFAAFVGLAVSLVRFSYSDARISALLAVVLLMLTVSLISLYTSTRRRRLSLQDHDRIVAGWPRRLDPKAPTVDVFLPTAGEPLAMLENTYRRVAAMRYPGTVIVHVLDDGARMEVAELAREYGFRYVVRPDRGRLKKAGNLAFAFGQTDGDVIAIFDADFAPREDYLLELMPHLDNPQIGIVQTPQYFQTYGVVSWLQRAAGATQELFYRWVQPSRDAIGAPICVGTCALYRRAALVKAGGFAQIDHSEDVHTGVNITAAGFAVRYIPVILAKGVCPDTLSSFIAQQYRWCAGSMGLMLNPRFRSLKLTVRQRLCYWSGFGYYITTALTGFTALIPPVFLLWVAPGAIHPGNYIWLVPAVLVYPLIALVHHGNWRLDVIRVQLIYSYAHAMAVWDTYRGSIAEWVATGAAKRTPLGVKVIRLMVGWMTLTQIGLWGGIVHVLGQHQASFASVWPLVCFAVFSTYIQLPVVVLACRGIRLAELLPSPALLVRGVRNR